MRLRFFYPADLCQLRYSLALETRSLARRRLALYRRLDMRTCTCVYTHQGNEAETTVITHTATMSNNKSEFLAQSQGVGSALLRMMTRRSLVVIPTLDVLDAA